MWSDKKRQNQERTHPRNDESSAGVQKDNGSKTEMLWARHEDGRRSRSEESDDESDTGEKEERETKDKVEGCGQEGHADCRTMKETGLTGNRRSTTIAATPDDGNIQRKRRRLHCNTIVDYNRFTHDTHEQ